jgi:hypothetical protein
MIPFDRNSNGGWPPGTDPDRMEDLVRRITLAAGPELARRHRERTLMRQFEEWSRPVYSAAALLILIFGSVLVLASRGEWGAETEGPLIVEAVLPNPLSLWVDMGTSPTLVEVLNAFEEGRP